MTFTAEWKRLRMACAAAAWLVAAGHALGQQAASLTRQDGKTVPVLSYPHQGEACRGVAIISPGAGGSEKGYAWLGTAMSSLGYLAVVAGHQESGLRALREHRGGGTLAEGLAALITDPAAYRGRFMDIAAALQWAQPRCTGREAILAGHSMGAATAMLEAGARNKLGVQGRNAFDAYIALSPQGVGTIFPQGAWADIRRPVFSVTGTRDTELGSDTWQSRTEPYQDMPAGCKWLGVIQGATHMNFAGLGMSRPVEALVTPSIAAFLDGVRRGDCKVPPAAAGMDIQSK